MTTGRGVLITLDGPGGVGKSTAIAATRQALTAGGRTVLAATQPSPTPFGQAVRAVAQSMRGRALALAVAADRLHQQETEIRPALAAGRTVLLDRYLPSTLVLQRADGVPVEDLLAMNAGVDVPDLSVILFAQADTVLRRLAHRGTRHRFETDPASTQREIDLYQEAIPHLEALGYRILTVDATDLTPTEVAATIASALPSRPATVIHPTNAR
ncbi:dTMP kinase [Streptomyces rubiginosohelvolus]|uniref:dTMP kinase n=1 Tax=Streptomyces rubiginosohelvolus TaxID=67362 RepID=UPI0033AD3AED